MRNRILQGKLSLDECDDNEVYEFLMLLKRQNQVSVVY